MPCSRASLSSVLVGLLATACASGPKPSDAPAKIDDLIVSIEHVHAEADRTRRAIADSFAKLQSLGNGEFAEGSALAAYSRFVQSIDATGQQARSFDSTIEAMRAMATPLFEQWEADLDRILHDLVRERSEQRLASTRERLQAIVDAAAAARGQLAVHIQAMRDYSTFLAHDLNTRALADLRKIYESVTADVQQLDNHFDVCQSAARTYVQNSALPTAAAPSR